MALVFAGLVPHSPLLAPNVGKEHRSQLNKTLEAYSLLAKNLLDAKPEVLVVVSPHIISGLNWWNANVCLNYQLDLSSFGDLLSQAQWPGALKLAQDLQDYLAPDQELRFYSQKQLDYGTSIPLLLLNESIKEVKVLPIGFIENQPEKQALFGKKLGDFIQQWSGKVALLGSGDLAHCLGSDQPSGLQSRGHKLDQRLQDALRQNDSSILLNISPDQVQQTGQCAWLTYLTIQATLANQAGQWHNLVYESPFGVGSAVWQWQFN